MRYRAVTFFAGKETVREVLERRHLIFFGTDYADFTALVAWRRVNLCNPCLKDSNKLSV